MPFQKGNTLGYRHGFAPRGNKTSEYRAWAAMKRRCFNKSQDNYLRYGGRGITVCTRWKHSFKNFLQDMCLKPSPQHSLDRIDGTKNYEPGNVRWASYSEQMKNRKPLRRAKNGQVLAKEKFQ